MKTPSTLTRRTSSTLITSSPYSPILQRQGKYWAILMNKQSLTSHLYEFCVVEMIGGGGALCKMVHIFKRSILFLKIDF